MYCFGWSWHLRRIRRPACSDAFAAGLLDFSERKKFTVYRKTRFFAKFSFRGRKSILMRRKFTLRQRPRSLVLPGPERTSRVNKKYFEAIGRPF